MKKHVLHAKPGRILPFLVAPQMSTLCVLWDKQQRIRCHHPPTVCCHANPLSQAHTTYFVVVDGYYHSAGTYTLSITCNNCPGGNATMSTAVPAGAGTAFQASELVGGGSGSGSGSPNATRAGSFMPVLVEAATGPTKGPPSKSDAAFEPQSVIMVTAALGRHLAGHSAAMGAEIKGSPLPEGGDYCDKGPCTSDLLATGSGVGSTTSSSGGSGSKGGTAAPSASATDNEFGTGRGSWQSSAGTGPAETTQGAQHGVETPIVFAVDDPGQQPQGTGGATGGTASQTAIAGSGGDAASVP